MNKKSSSNPIMNNIRVKFGWSLNEYCYRKGLDTSTVRHIVYNGVGKSFRNNKTTEAIKILSEDGIYVR